MPHGAKKYEGEQITMLTFDDSYFLGETRDGFYIEPMMKCAWAAQLEVMCVIKQICEKYDIPYFAYYGTLLGTIRHKGFIPWDDDMDICMLRKDYQRFLEVTLGSLPESIISTVLILRINIPLYFHVF